MNEAALDFRLGFLQADIFGERAAANGDQNFFRGRSICGFAGLILVSDGGALRVLLHGFDFRFELDANALLSETLLEFGGNFLVFERHARAAALREG